MGGSATSNASAEPSRPSGVASPSAFRQPADDRVVELRELFLIHGAARMLGLDELVVWHCAAMPETGGLVQPRYCPRSVAVLKIASGVAALPPGGGKRPSAQTSANVPKPTRSLEL
jgi:hypothetical protein